MKTNERGEPLEPRARYESSHWGEKARKEHIVNDPHLPRELVEMGRLDSFLIRTGRGVDFELTIPSSPVSLLSFTTSESERLFLILPPETRRAALEMLWVDGAPTYWLMQVGRKAGGRQASFSHAPVRVQAIGPALNIRYRTTKKGDGPSIYDHRFGEDGGTEPWLCLERDGHLWLAGGSYEVHDDGIVN